VLGDLVRVLESAKSRRFALSGGPVDFFRAGGEIMTSRFEIKIVINSSIPGALPSLADSWENAVKQKRTTGNDFIWIHYSGHRDTSRWQSTPRKRPFLVEYVSAKNIDWTRLGTFKTLDAATIAARKYAKEYEIRAWVNYQAGYAVGRL